MCVRFWSVWLEEGRHTQAGIWTFFFKKRGWAGGCVLVGGLERGRREREGAEGSERASWQSAAGRARARALFFGI